MSGPSTPSCPDVVLVPGAGGTPFTWSRVAALLRDAGAHTNVVDLSGPDPAVDLHGYVERVVGALRDSRQDGPLVLVGLSFGGFSASAAALVEPVDHLVLVNAMIPAPAETGASWWRAVDVSAARRENEAAAGRDPSRPFELVDVFLHDADADLTEQFLAHDRDEVDAAFATPWPGERWPDAPTTVLVGDDDRLFPRALQRRVARDRLGLDVTTVPGGHLDVLTRPREVADAILAAVG